MIRDWILGLRDPYNRNNAGGTEADNPGQALLLIPLVSARNHPLLVKVLAEVPRFEGREGSAKFLRGRSDFNEHATHLARGGSLSLRAFPPPAR